MSDYYDRLGHDLSAVGMDSLASEPVEDHYGLYKLLQRVSRRLQDPDKLVRDADAPIQTALGRSICRMLQNDQRMYDVEGFRCCAESEPFLFWNINNRDKSEIDRPIILTDANEPVGILKTQGDRTCYGLVDDPTMGLVAGAFSAAETFNRINPYMLDTSSHPWQLDIGNLDPLYPTRFGLFLVPMAERQHLEPLFDEDQPMLQISHAQIATRAAELLAEARSLDPAETYV